MPNDNETARDAFKLWLALPPEMRQPKTQRDLAETLGVHYNSLTNWRKDAAFMRDVQQIVLANLEDALPAVFANITKRASSGDKREWVDLYLSLIGGAGAVAGANATMNVKQTMTDTEAAALLARAGIPTAPALAATITQGYELK